MADDPTPLAPDRLRNHDYEGLFTGGECYRLALFLNQETGAPIVGVGDGGTRGPSWKHIWVDIGHGYGVDVRGRLKHDLIARLAIGFPCGSGYPVPKPDVERVLAERVCSPELELAMIDAAKKILSTHVRFELAFNQEVRERWRGNAESLGYQS